MNQKCLIENHSNKSIITICLAPQCQGKRLCCSKCQAELHQHHSQDQFVAFNDLQDFINIQSQKPNVPSPKVMQALQELNNILRDIDDLTKLIQKEIQRLSSANLQQFCKNLGNQYKIFTEQIGNQQWNDLAQEMLSHVELKEGEIVEKDSFVTHLGQPYSQFMKEFSLILTKMVKELKVGHQIINPNQSVIDQKPLVLDQKQNMKEGDQNMNDQKDKIVDPNPFSKMTKIHALKSHTNTISAIDICEQKNLLVSGSWDSTVKMWNLQDGTLLKTYKDRSYIYDVVFSIQGNFIAYGGGSNKIINLIEIKDLKDNDIVSELKGHTGSVTRLSFSNDQTYLISGSYDDTVRVWSVKTKQELFKLETGSTVFGLAMSRDNRLIVSHSQTKGIIIWDFKGQKLLCQHQGHTNGQGITFSNDEKQLISSGSDGKVKIWSLSELDQGKLPLIKEFKAANEDIQKVLLTSDSRFIIFYCFIGGYVKVIDSNTGEQVQLFEFKNKITDLSDFMFQGVAITEKMDVVAYGDRNDVVVWKRGQ